MNKTAFDSIFEPHEALEMRLRCDILFAIEDLILSKGLSKSDVKSMFSIGDSRASELINGKISSLPLKRLIKYLSKISNDVEFSVKAE